MRCVQSVNPAKCQGVQPTAIHLVNSIQARCREWEKEFEVASDLRVEGSGNWVWTAGSMIGDGACLM